MLSFVEAFPNSSKENVLLCLLFLSYYFITFYDVSVYVPLPTLYSLGRKLYHSWNWYIVVKNGLSNRTVYAQTLVQ